MTYVVGNDTAGMLNVDETVAAADRTAMKATKKLPIKRELI